MFVSTKKGRELAQHLTRFTQFFQCTTECTFNSTKFLGSDRKSLDLNQVRAHLDSELENEEDADQLYETYVKCDKHGESRKNEKPNVAQYYFPD